MQANAKQSDRVITHRILPAFSDMEIDDAAMQGMALADKDFTELEREFNAMDIASVRVIWKMLPGEVKDAMKSQMPAEYEKFEKMIGG